MTLRAVTYLFFTLLLAGIFAGIIAYYYRRKRYDHVEAPKYRMLADDDYLSGPAGSDREG